VVVDLRSKVVVAFRNDTHGRLNPLDHDVEVAPGRLVLLTLARFNLDAEFAQLLAYFVADLLAEFIESLVNPGEPFVNPSEPFINPSEPFINPGEPFINPSELFIDPDESFVDPRKSLVDLLETLDNRPVQLLDRHDDSILHRPRMRMACRITTMNCRPSTVGRTTPRRAHGRRSCAASG
jgi:hypothetical protein